MKWPFSGKQQNEELTENWVRQGFSLCAPADGQMVPLEEVPDAVFSQRVLGDGVAIVPAVPSTSNTEVTFTAPCDGTVEVVAPTGHSYGIKTQAGVVVLLHIGINTALLNGAFFTPCVEVGQMVQAGDSLVKVDVRKVVEAGYNLITPMIVSELGPYEVLQGTAEDRIHQGETCMWLEK